MDEGLREGGDCTGSDGRSRVAALALDSRCEGVELPLRLAVWEVVDSGLRTGLPVVSIPTGDDLRLAGRDSMELRLEVRLCDLLEGCGTGVSALPVRR